MAGCELNRFLRCRERRNDLAGVSTPEASLAVLSTPEASLQRSCRRRSRSTTTNGWMGGRGTHKRAPTSKGTAPDSSIANRFKNMSLMRGLSAARSAILRRFQVGYNEFPLSTPVSVGIFRGMAEGTFLDKNDVTDRVLSIVKNFEKVEPGKVTPSADFQKDLGLDSLDTVEVVMAFEEEFCIEIPDSEADKILSTSDAISYISGHPQAK